MKALTPWVENGIVGGMLYVLCGFANFLASNKCVSQFDMRYPDEPAPDIYHGNPVCDWIDWADTNIFSAVTNNIGLDYRAEFGKTVFVVAGLNFVIGFLIAALFTILLHRRKKEPALASQLPVL